jgi:hypothetical protein
MSLIFSLIVFTRFVHFCYKDKRFLRFSPKIFSPQGLRNEGFGQNVLFF